MHVSTACYDRMNGVGTFGMGYLLYMNYSSRRPTMARDEDLNKLLQLKQLHSIRHEHRNLTNYL